MHEASVGSRLVSIEEAPNMIRLTQLFGQLAMLVWQRNDLFLIMLSQVVLNVNFP